MTRSLASRPRQDLQVFGEASDAAVEAQAEGGVLGELVAGANAEEQPTRGELLERTGHLGQQCRMAEAGREDHAADLDALGGRADGGHQRPGVGVGVEHARPRFEVEVVGDPDRVEADALGALGIAEHLAMVGLRQAAGSPRPRGTPKPMVRGSCHPEGRLDISLAPSG